MEKPIKDGGDALERIKQIHAVIVRPVAPAAVLLNDLTAEEQAAIIKRLERSQAFQKEARERLRGSGLLDLIDGLNALVGVFPPE